MFALEMRNLLERFRIMIRHDGVHGERKLIRADYKRPVRIRLPFSGNAERLWHSAQPTESGRQRSLRRLSAADLFADLAAGWPSPALKRKRQSGNSLQGQKSRCLPRRLLPPGGTRLQSRARSQVAHCQLSHRPEGVTNEPRRKYSAVARAPSAGGSVRTLRSRNGRQVRCDYRSRPPSWKSGLVLLFPRCCS
jgi:hypothetical protein